MPPRRCRCRVHFKSGKRLWEIDLGIIDHRTSIIWPRSKNGFQLRRKTPSHDQIAIQSIRYFLLLCSSCDCEYCDPATSLFLSLFQSFLLSSCLFLVDYYYTFFTIIVIIIIKYQRRLSLDNFSLFMSSSYAFWVL